MKRAVVAIVLVVLLAGLGAAVYFALGPDAGDEAAPGAGGGQKTSAEPLELTDADFSSVTGSGVTLVDFWSPRCPPCRRQGPIVDRLAGKFAGRARVAKLNVNENPGAAREFNIMYIPTLIVFRDGKAVKRFTGLKSESDLASALEGALAGK